MNQQQRFPAIALGLMCVFLAGCSGQPSPVDVQGTASYKGTPIADAVITFHSTNGMPQATGTTDAEGKYQLSSMTGKPGIVPGNYGVSIALIPQTDDDAPRDSSGVAYEEAMRNAEQRQLELEETLPGRFGSPETSGLTGEVQTGEKNIIDFELDE